MQQNVCDLVSLSMKNTTILLIGVFLPAIAGCTNSFEKARDAAGRAPGWYDDRRVEIRGEGYPKLAAVPEIAPNALPGQTLPLSLERAEALVASFEDEPRAQPATMTAEDIRQFAHDARLVFAEGLPPGNFLTEDDVAAIHESFNVPRVTRGLRGQR